MIEFFKFSLPKTELFRQLAKKIVLQTELFRQVANFFRFKRNYSAKNQKYCTLNGIIPSKITRFSCLFQTCFINIRTDGIIPPKTTPKRNYSVKNNMLGGIIPPKIREKRNYSAYNEYSINGISPKFRLGINHKINDNLLQVFYTINTYINITLFLCSRLYPMFTIIRGRKSRTVTVNILRELGDILKMFTIIKNLNREPQPFYFYTIYSNVHDYFLLYIYV
jgi:hypothetical protein